MIAVVENRLKWPLGRCGILQVSGEAFQQSTLAHFFGFKQMNE